MDFGNGWRAGLVWAASAAWFASAAAAADKVDLADFFPNEVGADYTYDGTFNDLGKQYSSAMTLVVTGYDGFAPEFTLRYRTETIYGSRKLVEQYEIGIEASAIRPLSFDSRVKSQGDTHTYNSWAKLLPRVVEIGKSYPIERSMRARYGPLTERGTTQISVEDVATALGTFNCVRLHQEVDSFSGNGTKDLRRATDEFYARGFGLVRFMVRTTAPGVVIERDVTVTSSSRPIVFKRAVGR